MASVYAKDGKWYLRYKDAAGRWRGQVSTAKTKTEAKRLVEDLARKAERQRLGVEPLPNESSMKLKELCAWYLKNHCSSVSLDRETSRLKTHVTGTELAHLPLGLVTPQKLEERLHAMERSGAAPSSVNRLRAMLSVMFEKAIRAGVWTGSNPAKSVQKRREPERHYETLKPGEFEQFLECTPDQWRDLFATGLLLGLRRGELFALRKTDVDLVALIATIRRSHSRPTTKGNHSDALPIPPALAPFLRHAIETSASEFVFPGPDGKIRSRHTDLASLAKRIMCWAGLVIGYDHGCRRCKSRGQPQVERHQDGRLRKCPQCGMALWVKPIPRPLRFHDLRHTFGTVLAQAGFDGVRLQRAMRHKDFKLTARYVHTNVDDLRAIAASLPAISAPRGYESAEGPGQRGRGDANEPERVQTAAKDFATPLLRSEQPLKEDAGTPGKNSLEIPASELARPRGFEPLAFGFVVRRSIQLS